MQKPQKFTTSQLIFKEFFVGTLIYAVVLGFFNDYTSIVSAKSFSTIFFAAILLQILTSAAFVLKNKVVAKFKETSKALMAFFVWLILFLSKFVFIWALNFVFGEYITVNGFFGILAVVATVTIAQKTANYIFEALGNK